MPSVETESVSAMPGSVTYLRHVILCALIFSFIWGCTGYFPTRGVRQPPDALSSSTVYDGRLTALAQIDLTTRQGKYPLRAVLVVQSPSWLRLELLPLIGNPDLYLTASPGRLSVFIPSQGEFYSGKPTAENLARFLPWAVSVEEMVAILSGTCFSPQKGYVSCRHPGEENQTPGREKPLADGAQAAQPARGFLKELVRYDEGRNEVYRASFDDYRPGAASPGRIALDFADGSVRVILRYTDMKVEHPTDMSVFELTAPGGATIIELDQS